MKYFYLVSLCILLITGCSSTPTHAIIQPTPTSTSAPAPAVVSQPVSVAPTPTEPPVAKKLPLDSDADKMNQRLGHGVNFGDALEAPKEGDWGFVIKDEYFPAIKSAGFNSVRIPISWPAHAATMAPYTIDADFFKRVDEVVDQAHKNNLLAILDMHNYDALMQNPEAEKARFIALWQQIADHYQSAPDDVLFELLNEPYGNLNYATWNDLIKEVLPVIRQNNPNRYLIIGPAMWNGVTYLDALELPESDTHIIVTFHYYSPMQLTHQGASWVQGSDAWMGTTWSGSAADRDPIRSDFDDAVDWALRNNRPLFLGEFGCYSNADPVSRLRWTTYIRQLAEARNFSWAYWDFGEGAGSAPGFGVYDPASDTWRKPLLDALIPPQ
jgi:endoglucanase